MPKVRQLIAVGLWLAVEQRELLSNLVFEALGSCSNPTCFGGFNSVFEFDAGDDFGEIIKAA
jgi:hypothetical protein